MLFSYFFKGAKSFLYLANKPVYLLYLLTTDDNECQNVTNICGDRGTCTNTVGSYYCTCVSGYTSTGVAKFQPNDGTECHGKCHSLSILDVQKFALISNYIQTELTEDLTYELGKTSCVWVCVKTVNTQLWGRQDCVRVCELFSLSLCWGG